MKNGVDSFAVHKSCHGEEYWRSCGRRSRQDKSIRMGSGIQNLGSRQSQVLKALRVGVRDGHQRVSACEKTIEDGGVPAQLRGFEVISVCQGYVPSPAHCRGEKQAGVRVADDGEVGTQHR